MPETYISIMIQSQKKKEQILDEIIRLDDRQREQLTNDECTADEFDQTVKEKERLIEQLDQLDDGFEEMYAQVKDELTANKDKYADEIHILQKYIRSITDKSVMIQAQEARNKHLMTQKFTKVKKYAKDVRANSRAITGYYRTMTQSAYTEPQFWEGKK